MALPQTTTNLNHWVLISFAGMVTDGRPAVCFLIPFAPRRAKNRWDIACAHLEQTLKSVRNSTSDSYCVVVAGHEPPGFNVQTDARFHFVAVDHCIPQHDDSVVAGRLDKLAKIAAAWSCAKSKWKPQYVMKLDADDLVSSRLVMWLGSFGGEPGYLIKHGWVWRSGACHLIQSTEYLDRTCGSCLIIKSNLADREGPFLTEVEGVSLDTANSHFANSDHHSLVPGSSRSTLLLNISHQRYAAQFGYLGQRLCTIPFKAIVYRIGNPESNSAKVKRGPRTLRMVLGKIRRTRFITKTLRKEFALE
jgi:hypothetical protein